jgi:hypothetical protein
MRQIVLQGFMEERKGGNDEFRVSHLTSNALKRSSWAAELEQGEGLLHITTF